MATTSSRNARKKEVRKETGLGLTYKKDENFGEWYSEVVLNSEMFEYYDISGCYIFLPWTIAIWETLKAFFNVEIKKLNVDSASFPSLLTQNALQKEKDHIEGFAPEVAWVTKCGQSNLETQVAIRPTSETGMYPYFSEKICGLDDLPLKLNQWCNVVRWEFSHPIPFIRKMSYRSAVKSERVLCRCGLPTIILMSRQEHSYGRQFYRCPRWGQGLEDCKFFRWFDNTSVTTLSQPNTVARGSMVSQVQDIASSSTASHTDKFTHSSVVSEPKNNHRDMLLHHKMNAVIFLLVILTCYFFFLFRFRETHY